MDAETPAVRALDGKLAQRLGLEVEADFGRADVHDRRRGRHGQLFRQRHAGDNVDLRVLADLDDRRTRSPAHARLLDLDDVRAR